MVLHMRGEGSDPRRKKLPKTTLPPSPLSLYTLVGRPWHFAWCILGKFHVFKADTYLHLKLPLPDRKSRQIEVETADGGKFANCI